MELHLTHAGGREVLKVGGAGNRITLTRQAGDGIEASIFDRGPGTLTLELEGQRHHIRFWRQGAVLYLHARGEVLRMALEDPDHAPRPGPGASGPVLRAPMPGRVLAVLVSAGDRVAAGAPLLRLEAMKMEIEIAAPFYGVVTSVQVREGELVEPDAELLHLDPVDGN